MFIFPPSLRGETRFASNIPTENGTRHKESPISGTGTEVHVSLQKHLPAPRWGTRLNAQVRLTAPAGRPGRWGRGGLHVLTSRGRHTWGPARPHGAGRDPLPRPRGWGSEGSHLGRGGVTLHWPRTAQGQTHLGGRPRTGVGECRHQLLSLPPWRLPAEPGGGGGGAQELRRPVAVCLQWTKSEWVALHLLALQLKRMHSRNGAGWGGQGQGCGQSEPKPHPSRPTTPPPHLGPDPTRLCFRGETRC